jgi:DNA-binding NarL/FixJ family response regulator
MLSPLRIVIADDHLIFRQGLKSLLKYEPEVIVVGETDRVDALPELLAHTPCDQLILDLQMERSSLADIETLAKRVPVVVLTASEVPADAVAAIRMGRPRPRVQNAWPWRRSWKRSMR